MGGLAGGLLGFAAQQAHFLVTAAWFFLAVLALGLFVELAGHPMPLPQRDAETPRSWIEDGWLGWAVKNGASLSLGFTTRIGFPVWYAIPCIALVSADPLTGALAWGLYGCTRTGLSVLAGVWVPGSSRLGSRGYAERMLDLRYRSRLLSSALGAALCVLVVVAAA